MNFLFFLQWSLQWIHLSWNDKHWQLQTWVYGAYWAIELFFCNVMTFLVGSASSVASGTSYESHDVILSLWYCTEHDKKLCGNQERSLFTAVRNLLERQTALAEVINVTWHFKQITHNTWTHHSGNRRWLWNYYSNTVCTLVNFLQLCFTTVSLYLSAFSSTVKVTMYDLCCVPKFWYILTFYSRFMYIIW